MLLAEPVFDPEVPEAGRCVVGRFPPTRDVAARMPLPSPIEEVPLVEATLEPLPVDPLLDARLPPPKTLDPLELDDDPPEFDEPAFDWTDPPLFPRPLIPRNPPSRPPPPPRFPRNCGAISDEYFSAAVVPVSRMVREIVPFETVAVLTTRAAVAAAFCRATTACRAQ